MSRHERFWVTALFSILFLWIVLQIYYDILNITLWEEQLQVNKTTTDLIKLLLRK